MPEMKKLKISKQILRTYFLNKFDFFPRVPKDNEANFYSKLEMDYLRDNADKLKEKKEKEALKRKEAYKVTKKVKHYQKVVEEAKKVEAVSKKINDRVNAAKIIQSKFRRFLTDKYEFNIEYEHALKKSVEHFKFGFSKNASYDVMVHNFRDYAFENLPKSIAVVTKHSSIRAAMDKIIKERIPNKVALTAAALYKDPAAKKEAYFVKHIHSTHEVVLSEKEIGNKLMDVADEVDSQIENTDSKKFVGFLGVVVRVMKYSPIGGSSYIELPEYLTSKKALINIKNEDDKCFIYSLMCSIMDIQKNPQRVSNYVNKMDLIQIPPTATVPPGYHDYQKFEKLNDITISVFYVHTNSPKAIQPFYISKYTSACGKKVDLLLVENDEGKKHYVVIKSLSRLLNTSISGDGHKVHFCRHCLSRFPTEEKLEEHMKLNCQSNDAVKVVLPTPEQATMSFKNVDKQLKAPYVIYADCESILKSQEAGDCCTKKYCKHVPISFRYAIVDNKKNVTTKDFCGETATEQFLTSLIEDATKLSANLKNTNVPLKWTTETRVAHEKADTCYLCSCSLNASNKCADHDHLTGAWRGAACSQCNLKCRNDRIPVSVFFHNGKGYDFHHIITHLGNIAKERELNIDCIPLNTEKYLTFGVKAKGMNIMFKDSFQFMSSSIDALVELMKKTDAAMGTNSFYYTKTHFRSLGYTDDQIALILRKGYFPYEWFDSEEKFNYDGLPAKEAFFSKLSGKGISDDEYAHAQEVYEKLGCKNFKDYHDLYLTCDVFLLADLFENFRDMCLKHFNLDPAHYFTNPGMFWDAALMKSGVDLELLTDIDMVLMFEKGIRGGISMISKRHAVANNPLVHNYDPSKPNSYIMYNDANNLYGWAMSKPLPTGNFKWEDPASFNTESIMSLDDNAEKGYVFMVDLEYPKELHHAHNLYPLAPETMTVTQDMVCDYNKKVSELNGLKVTECQKLVPNLMDKTGYVCHMTNLKLYMSLGLKLKKVHKVISFDQRPWLRNYIDYNTQQRIKAKKDKNNFLADLYKLANNAVFGKTMENVRKRSNLDLVSRDDKFLLKKLASPRIQHVTIFNESLVCIQMRKTQVTINKPIYVGMCILDLSKTLMYDFHYNTMLKKYGHENCELLFTDTDSLCYHIKTDDLYKDLEDVKQQFDFSEYDTAHALYSPDNKAVIGKFKDETAGVPITEFVGLKPKMYAFTCGGKEKRVAKGISKNTKTTFQQYKDTLYSKGTTSVTQHSIRTYKHEIFSVEQTKLGLSPIDTKRHICDDGINTLAYGHYLI